MIEKAQDTTHGDAPQPATSLAFEVLKNSLAQDHGYAWSWFCNLCMAFVDAGGDRLTAHKGAATFMERCYGVDIAQSQAYKDAVAELTQPADFFTLTHSTPGVIVDVGESLTREALCLAVKQADRLVAFERERRENAEKAHSSECSMMNARIFHLEVKLKETAAQRDERPTASQLKEAEQDYAEAAAALRNLGYVRRTDGRRMWVQGL
jgi:hypothetical protein